MKGALSIKTRDPSLNLDFRDVQTLVLQKFWILRNILQSPYIGNHFGNLKIAKYFANPDFRNHGNTIHDSTIHEWILTYRDDGISE